MTTATEAMTASEAITPVFMTDTSGLAADAITGAGGDDEGESFGDISLSAAFFCTGSGDAVALAAGVGCGDVLAFAGSLAFAGAVVTPSLDSPRIIWIASSTTAFSTPS